MANIEEIKALKSKSVEELYIMLGEELLSEVLGADEFSDEEKQEEAKEWENENNKRLRELICSSDIYQKYIQNPGSWEWVTIVNGLASIITPIAIEVTAATVVALLIKKGLNKFCENI